MLGKSRATSGEAEQSGIDGPPQEAQQPNPGGGLNTKNLVGNLKGGISAAATAVGGEIERRASSSSPNSDAEVSSQGGNTQDEQPEVGGAADTPVSAPADLFPSGDPPSAPPIDGGAQAQPPDVTPSPDFDLDNLVDKPPGQESNQAVTNTDADGHPAVKGWEGFLDQPNTEQVAEGPSPTAPAPAPAIQGNGGMGHVRDTDIMIAAQLIAKHRAKSRRQANGLRSQNTGLRKSGLRPLPGIVIRR